MYKNAKNSEPNSVNKKTGKIFSFLFFTTVIIGMFLFNAWKAFNYSTWNMDEEKIVICAVGFLGFDFNPYMFIYHTLPIYILSFVYFIIYFFYSMCNHSAKFYRC